MLNLRVIITPLICLQNLLIEHLEKDNFMKISKFHFCLHEIDYKTFCPREIIWVRKTGARYLQPCIK